MASVPSDDPAAVPVHGLSYPPAFLSSLPILLPRPSPHTPIRALSASQFADLHLRALLSHAPDAALFPFLHGLEGDNEAQNLFFASPRHAPGSVPVPTFRGLVWVAADDDDDDDTNPASSRIASAVAAARRGLNDEDDEFASEDDDDDDDDDEDFDEDFSSSDLDVPDPTRHEESFPMDMDMDMDVDPPPVHMHPVQHRAQPTPIYTSPLPPFAHDRTSSTGSSSSSSAASSLSASDSPSTPATSVAASPPPFSPASCPPLPSPVAAATHKFPAHRTEPALLTSSFRAHEILRDGPGPEHPHEFVHPRVPEGISLRNFGIQVVSLLFAIFPLVSSLFRFSSLSVFSTAGDIGLGLCATICATVSTPAVMGRI